MNDSDRSVELAATPELAAAQWSKLYREDADFRAEFDKDPRKAISRRVGVELPAKIKVIVHRKKAGEIHITVPEDVEADAFEMSDEMLRDISGSGARFAVPAPALAFPAPPPPRKILRLSGDARPRPEHFS